MKRFTIITAGFIHLLNQCQGQVTDTMKVKKLSPVTIEAYRTKNDLLRLEPVSGTFLFSGKKNEVISVTSIDANITERTARQLFAKVPGVFVYDLEGGNQLNIATRGLDPHRGWEYNQRKDGIISNSDLYAYPASHYSIPMESVERIELVRGTGSLQYGAQFGGMLNYITKRADTTKPFGFESFNTVGSFNLLSSYNAVGGKINKITYYAGYTRRSRDGYRKNEHTDYDAQQISLTYEPAHKLSFHLDWARSSYLYQIPGPLTDAMFLQAPRQATRFRNYFSPTINIPSLTVKWDITTQTKLTFSSSAVLGQRSSVIYDKPATVMDTINTTTYQYNNRQTDIDNFNSYSQELRILHNYKLAKIKNTIATGFHLTSNHLHRNQLGKGTNGTDYDLTLTDPVWGRDIHFRTNNIALFAENNIQVSKNLTLNLGIRWETGASRMSGNIVYYPDNELPVSIRRQFLLSGAGFSFKLSKHTELYGGASQTYRPVLFKDVVPASVFEKVDPNIKDADGYNAELGCRGGYKFLKWDITGFVLQYNRRFSTLALTDNNGNFYTYRTNIGNSTTRGLEVFIQGNWLITPHSQLTIFTATSLMDGRYTSGAVKSGNNNIPLKGKKIESVPGLIARTGATWQIQQLSITLLCSHTGSTFADPANTGLPNATGTVGKVPSYTILDLNSVFKITKNIELRAGVNNLTNKQYFTKRPLFYPGPGVWPSDGRSTTCSLIFRL